MAQKPKEKDGGMNYDKKQKRTNSIFVKTQTKRNESAGFQKRT